MNHRISPNTDKFRPPASPAELYSATAQARGLLVTGSGGTGMLFGMSERGEPNWQPIGMLPMLLDMVAGMVDGAREQEQLLRDAPRYSLDTDTLDHVERVYREGGADNGVFAQQLARWQRDHPGAEGLAGFAALVDELEPAYERVLDLAAARRGDTIEALHTKSNLQVGVEALLGSPRPDSDRS